MALTVAGALLGLLVAHWSSRIVLSVAPPQLATQSYTILDWQVLGFLAALTVMIGLLFGVIPTWLVGRLQPSSQLIRVQIGTRDVATRRVRAVLIALQAALTLTLVAGSLALANTFLRLVNAELGFRPNNVVTMNVSLQGTKRRTGPAEWQFYNSALDHLGSMPGVEAAGAVSFLPLATNAYLGGTLRLDSGQRVPLVTWNSTTPGYFKAMGMRVLAGRDFVFGELQGSVIVNEVFVRQAGLGPAIVGRRLIAPWSDRPYSIIGVVNTAVAAPGQAGTAQTYWPVEEEPPEALTFVARVRDEAEKRLAMCRDAIRAVDPEVPIYDVKTLDERLDEVLARPRFYTMAMLFFAMLAILLAAIAVYGAASYSVTQRRHELGVRIALGATPIRLRAMVILENLVPTALGAFAGLAGAIGLQRYLEHLIAGAASLEASSCAIAAIFLVITAGAASWPATGSILSIDPRAALRAE